MNNQERLEKLDELTLEIYYYSHIINCALTDADNVDICAISWFSEKMHKIAKKCMEMF